MNRKQFLSRLFLGAAAIAVAPEILAAKKPYVKPEITTEGIVPYLVRTADLSDRKPIIEYIEGVGWYSDQEKEMIAKMREQMEWSMMFGKIERVEPFDKYYARANGVWSD